MAHNSGLRNARRIQQADHIIAEQGKVEINCEFCGRQYVFDAVDATQLFAGNRIAKPGETRH